LTLSGAVVVVLLICLMSLFMCASCHRNGIICSSDS